MKKDLLRSLEWPRRRRAKAEPTERLDSFIYQLMPNYTGKCNLAMGCCKSYMFLRFA